MELQALAEAHPGWTFVGVNPVREMLRQAERTLGLLMDRVTLIHGYIDDAPAGPFDAATCLLTLHFLPAGEREAGPIAAAHQRAHLAATRKEGKRKGPRISRGHATGSSWKPAATRSPPDTAAGASPHACPGSRFRGRRVTSGEPKRRRCPFGSVRSPSCLDDRTDLARQSLDREGLGDHLHARIEVAGPEGGVLRVAGHEQHLQFGSPDAGLVGELAPVQPG